MSNHQEFIKALELQIERQEKERDERSKTYHAYRVYFVLDPNTTWIKIGVTQNINERIPQLRTNYKSKLTLLGWIYGDTDRERELHEQFQEFRIAGEWFTADQSLMDFIRTNCQSWLPLRPRYKPRKLPRKIAITVMKDQPEFAEIVRLLNIDPDSVDAGLNVIYNERMLEDVD